MSQTALRAITINPMTTTMAAIVGCARARNATAATKPSSDRLSAQFESGSGLALTATRVPAFAKWLLDASAAPMNAAAVCAAGLALAAEVTAMNAPPAGRMMVCTRSQTESTHGILSAKNSTTYNTIAEPMIQLLSNRLYCGGRSTQ